MYAIERFHTCVYWNKRINVFTWLKKVRVPQDWFGEQARTVQPYGVCKIGIFFNDRRITERRRREPLGGVEGHALLENVEILMLCNAISGVPRRTISVQGVR